MSHLVKALLPGCAARRWPRYARCIARGGAMAAGVGDDRGPIGAGRGRLRASHADREQVIGALQLAFVQGRLTKDELDARLGQTLASRTYADLAALTADLPPGLAPAQARQPRRARPVSPAAKMLAATILIVPAPA